jgi:hypothetical protein
MPDLSRLSHNYAPAKPSAHVAALDLLPALNAPASKPSVQAAVIPSLANAARLPDALLPACALPRESSPRMMNPTEVPLTDAGRFKSLLPPSLA